MILFIISLILICISSYFIASIFAEKTSKTLSRQVLGFLYFLLSAFSQIILSFEILSLFSLINPNSFILLNLIFFTISFCFWLKNGKPLYRPTFRNEIEKIKKALLKDKSLIILALSFLFFIVITLIIGVFVSANSYDALVYHIARVPFWLSNGNLNHFDYPDLRMNVMPINSELLYAWVLLFFKKDWFVGCFSFVSYLASVLVLYNFLGELKFSTRKKLWTVFMFSSMASILAEASGTETEIIIGALAFTSLYMWCLAVRNESKILIYFSALSYALAIGTKTPSIISFVPCLIFMAMIAWTYKKNQIVKPFLYFFSFLIINFIIFSSFNYVLNFITYANPVGSRSAIEIHAFYGGFKAFFANLVRYFFLMIDFSGFNYADKLGPYVIALQNKIFAFLHIPKDWGVLIPAGDKVNNSLLDPLMGPGLLGFLVFLPCVFYSLLSLFKIKQGNDFVKHKKMTFMICCAGLFILNVIVLSCSLGFMVFSVRFLTYFIIISSPVLVLSYIRSNKNIFKWLLIFYSFSYMVVISSHLSARPFFKLAKIYTMEKSLDTFRERLTCSDTFGYTNDMPVCLLKRELERYNKPKNIAVFIDPNFRAYPLKMKEKDGWKVDFLLLENLNPDDLDKYNYIVTNYVFQDSELVKHPERTQDYILTKDYLKFLKKRPVNCFYLDQYNVLIEKGSKSKPIVSLCYIPTELFKAKGFREIIRIKVHGKDQTPQGYKDIIVYERM